MGYYLLFPLLQGIKKKLLFESLFSNHAYRLRGFNQQKLTRQVKTLLWIWAWEAPRLKKK
jgi:hypothetical protein